MHGIERTPFVLTGEHRGDRVLGIRWHRRHVVLYGFLCLAVLMSLLPGRPPSALAQNPACVTSGQGSGTYTVRLCLTGPDDGDTLSGNVEVSATISIESGIAPPIEHVQFFFTPQSSDRSRSVLRDYVSPFTFTLPTARWTDRAYRLEVEAEFEDDHEEEHTTPKAGIAETTANGVTHKPVSTGRWSPHHVNRDDPVVVAAVGNGADGLPESTDVAELIEGWDPDMLLYLGDVYNSGSYTEFLNYYDPTLGRMKDITNPTPGNHEGNKHFEDYLDYWDASQHYYTATAGNWRLIALNSTGRFGQTSPGTEQFEWLRAQLAADDDAGCTMVFFHEPRWALKTPEDYAYLDDLWALLVKEDVDLVLNAHEHRYERWMPLNERGMPDADGPTQFVAGTGGHELNDTRRIDPRREASSDEAGALRLELRDGKADYEFIDTAGDILDGGSLSCDTESVAEPSGTTVAAGETGRIVNTGGAGARCRVEPDLNAAIITVVPEGTPVELREALEGAWQPVRCDGRDGYIAVQFIAPGK